MIFEHPHRVLHMFFDMQENRWKSIEENKSVDINHSYSAVSAGSIVTTQTYLYGDEYRNYSQRI